MPETFSNLIPVELGGEAEKNQYLGGTKDEEGGGRAPLISEMKGGGQPKCEPSK